MAKPAAIQKVGRSKHVRLLVHGDPGVGKTRFAGTSPGKVLLLRPPVEHTDSLLPEDRARVEEWVIQDHDELQQALDYLRHEGEEWDWVWFDNISLWQDVGLDDLWETVIAERPGRARYGLDKQEYNINMTRLSRFIRYVVGPDKFHFGVVAHSAELKPSEDPEAREKLMPWIQGKNMSPKICGYMNMVAFYERAEFESGGETSLKRVMRFEATDRYYAKDQFDAFLPSHRLLEPTMPKLVAAVNKVRGEKPASATKRPAKATRPVRRVTR